MLGRVRRRSCDSQLKVGANQVKVSDFTHDRTNRVDT
ncbi:hypothetical protein C7456_1192 [Fulvimonas soli]|uniref:Uncharacterized protein n=1 Tax=Fulvimonas soli TaxID=155197 RepID=A0A316HNR3_9GAMM|nr:hypothetical protein C7456_1192 [Fulvimonas soli]